MIGRSGETCPRAPKLSDAGVIPEEAWGAKIKAKAITWKKRPQHGPKHAAF